MISVRPIAADELSAFFSLEPDPQRAADQVAYVDRMIATGAMRRAWFHLATDDGDVVGRFAFWSLPRLSMPISFVLLDVAPDIATPEGRARIAAALLERAIGDAVAASAPEFGYVLDEPEQTPQWQREPGERARWLDAAGFRVVRSTSRWSYDGPPPPSPSRLVLRTFEAVGETAFLEALERVSSTTLDARTVAARDRLGAPAEARETLEDLRGMESRPGWWRLAYDSAGDLVGLVMPALAPAMATIGYIGVVPEQRGRRYIDDLLAIGTATLRQDAPDLQIRADTDLANAPMAAAFERAGYVRFATRREFEVPI